MAFLYFLSHGLGGEAEPPALLGAEAVDEQGNVLRPGPQGRQVEFDGGQAVVEIRPESPPLAHGQQVLVVLPSSFCFM